MAWVVPRRRGARLRLGRRGLLVLAAASLPTLLTVALEWAGILFPSNVVRAVWAVPLGAAAAWMSVRMLLAEADDGPVPGPAAHGLV